MAWSQSNFLGIHLYMIHYDMHVTPRLSHGQTSTVLHLPMRHKVLKKPNPTTHQLKQVGKGHQDRLTSRKGYDLGP